MKIYFKNQPEQNHEMFFSYDDKKEKSICGRNEAYPCVIFKDSKHRSGRLKVVCVDNEPANNNNTSQYRLHRHKLVDYSIKTKNCDETGVATFIFKASEYTPDDEIMIYLENLSIRRTKESLRDVELNWSLNKTEKFDPFGIGFGNLKKRIDLNCTRLCCQVILDDGTTTNLPIVSDTIQNCKNEIKVHEWIDGTETESNGAGIFYVFTSELKSDQRDVYVVFIDEFEREFARVIPDYVHCNRALRLTVPKHPRCMDAGTEYPKCCKFYIAVKNRNYKSVSLSFEYIKGYKRIKSENNATQGSSEDLITSFLSDESIFLFFNNEIN